MFDSLIQNATVFSGKNEAPQKTQVGIRNQKIEAISPDLRPEQARQVIDGTGLYLTPGFIDPHASTGFGYFFPKAADHKLHQGITTEIFGNCGTSPGPIGDRLVPTMERLSEEIGFPFGWRSMGEYFEKIQDHLQFNIASLVGHSTLRGGYLQDWNKPTASEIETMKAALAQAMDEGALGMSTGLIYSPGCFAETEEIVALAEVVKEKGGLYASHIRNERDLLEEAIEEALNISQQAGLRVLISHLKAAERPNWGKIPRVIERIERYNSENGNSARVDVYPYTAVSTKLRAFIPKYLLDEGTAALPQRLQRRSAVEDIQAWIEQKGYELDQMMVISNDISTYHARTISELAGELKLSLSETMARVIRDNPDTWIVYHCIQQEDIDYAIEWEKAMVCTDSWSYPINAPRTIGQPHPRSYGAFTTYLQRYVLEKQSLSWQEAIHKITQAPAEFFGLKKRGLVAEGYHADLVLLDPSKVKARATYLDPKQLSEGVVHLWVNGKHTIEQGKVRDDAQGGQVLSL
jgi:N-acyl-D-amino-acid deacylase